MKYKKSEVIEIIKGLTDKDAESILFDWNVRKSNKLLELLDYKYPVFVYSFPVEIDNKLVATITLANVYFISTSTQDDLMQKYFGHKLYSQTYVSFSHDTYLNCYFTVYEEFCLPNKIGNNFRYGEFKGVDAKGKEFRFVISQCGFEILNGNYCNFNGDTYNFYEINIDIKIEQIENGWELGETINENINKRINENK